MDLMDGAMKPTKTIYDENYEDKRKFSDKFVTEVKKILGEQFLIEAPLIEDLKKNTDIRSFVMWPIRYGFRVRSNSDIHFNKDFTLFYESPKGSEIEVEFHKMLKGYGDYFLYGFADEEEKGFACWGICNLNVLRGFIENYAAKNNGELPGKIIPKYTKKKQYLGKFIAFKWKDLPEGGVFSSMGLGLDNLKSSKEAVKELINKSLTTGEPHEK